MMMGIGSAAMRWECSLNHHAASSPAFLGALLIHGCREEQDIGHGRVAQTDASDLRNFRGRNDGAIGSASFSQALEQDEILHSALNWQPSHWPFYCGIRGPS